ncbi:MAG: phosphate ABC transporter ATP-binding protein [Candidatus Aminicenantales bacterium]
MMNRNDWRFHISLRGLNVYYGCQHVLKNINLDIPDRQITVIIGPSGCGKTTLLKSLNRLLDSAEGVRVEGQVLVDGEDIYASGVEVTRIRKKMGLLSQRPQVLPMSIYDNVAYGPRIHGIKERKKLDQMVEHYLRIAGLWDEVKGRLSEPASRLSVGQQQRLCLARGLAVEPEIILGDEPTSALDPQSSQNVERCLLSLKSQYTVLVVTHILRQAKRIADYIVFLYLGEIVEHGPAESVFNQPKDARTKAYLSGEIS